MDWIVAKMQGGNTRRLDRVILTQKLSVDYYRPVIKRTVRRRGKRHHVIRPFLFDYIFLRYNLIETGSDWLSMVPITLIIFGDRIATVTDVGIDALRTTITDIEQGREPSRRWLGRAVIIKATAMGDVYGTVVGVSDNGQWLDIEIKCFNRSITCHKINSEYVVPLRN